MSALPRGVQSQFETRESKVVARPHSSAYTVSLPTHRSSFKAKQYGEKEEQTGASDLTVSIA